MEKMNLVPPKAVKLSRKDVKLIGNAIKDDKEATSLFQEGTGKSGSYGMWNHPRGHVWNVFVRPASS